MSNEDYQLEAAEDAAVKKSNTAKRAAIGAGLLAAGAATAYGAEQIVGADHGHTADSATITPETDLTSGAAAGAVEGGVAEQPQATAEPQVVHENTTVNNYIVHTDESTDPELEISETHFYYDEEGNRLGAIEEGSYDGKNVVIVDQDGDNKADVMWYDQNGDGHVQDNEVYDVSGANYTTGHGQTDVTIVEAEDPAPNPDPDPEPYSEEIRNDDDGKGPYNEKTGETYRQDLAENNRDYNPDGNTSPYAAGAHAHHDTTDPEIAQNITEEKGGETDELAYNSETENVTDDGEVESHEYDGYNSESYAYEEDTTDNVDDVDQYDLV